MMIFRFLLLGSGWRLQAGQQNANRHTKVAGAATPSSFQTVFGGEPTVVARAPGRVNLIGEHTDYTEGFVLPAAIDLETRVLARPQMARRLDVWSELSGEVASADLERLESPPDGDWRRYVFGMARSLAEAGYRLSGAQLHITGTIPIRAGLSSSASLELAVGLALTEVSGERISPETLARLSQHTENHLVGVQCGLMDQMAILFGKEGMAVLIDCRSMKVEPVPLPPDVSLLIIDTGVRRNLAATQYNRRREECRSALESLRRVNPEISELRDVDAALLDRSKHALSALNLRRTRHVVTENQRVLRAAQAFHAGDVRTVGRLMNESHESLRQDYEVSGPELDLMAGLLREQAGVYGARLTGAGFGGCCVALTKTKFAQVVARRVTEQYRTRTGLETTAHICRPAERASVSEVVRP